MRPPHSDRVIEVNIEIIRVFTQMREMLMTNREILLKLEQLEKQTFRNTDDIRVIFDHLKQLLIPPEQTNRQRIGFRRVGEKG